MRLKRSIARCDPEPLPDVPHRMSSGRALARLMSSRTLFTGNDGCTTSICGRVAIRLTPAKSRTGSNGGFFIRMGVTSRLGAVMRKV